MQIENIDLRQTRACVHDASEDFRRHDTPFFLPRRCGGIGNSGMMYAVIPQYLQVRLHTDETSIVRAISFSSMMALRSDV